MSIKTNTMAAVAAAAVFVTAGAAYAVPGVANVVMTQRANSRIVDITYELTGEAAIVTLGIETNGVALPDSAVTRLTGDVCKKVATGAGKAIVWNAGADWPENLTQTAKAKVTAWATNTPPLYMVVDLSGGSATNYYPVSYHVSAAALPAGGLSNDLYRTMWLVMRRVRTQVAGSQTENGVFTMGSQVGETYRQAGTETPHVVTLTKDFYMGVFGVTQSQWQQVMNARPSYFNNVDYWMTRPVEQVTYNNIRGSSAGAGWPGSSAVDGTSFMGKLRDRTGLATLDLPTDAQREYACRAGTSGSLNDGTANLTNANSDARLNLLGRYQYSGGYIGGVTIPAAGCTPANGTATVGSYQPNAWGLYDMQCNVWEWCLDWYAADLTTAAVADPQGASSGTGRVRRGMSWDNPAQYCRSAFRSNLPPANLANSVGFRVAMTLP